MNASKTQAIVCGSRQNLAHIHTESPPTLDIEGEPLPLDSVVKDLGVLLDEQMTFGPHVDNMVRQMTGILCYLARIRYFLTEDATKLLVHSLVLSRLNYCSVVWGGLNKSHVRKLQKTVNFAARVIHGARKYDHVSPLLQELNWLTVENMLNVATACFMYKVTNGLVPSTCTRMFTRTHEVSRRTTRQSQDFYLPKVRTEAGRRSLTFRGSKLWNELPDSVKM